MANFYVDEPDTCKCVFKVYEDGSYDVLNACKLHKGSNTLQKMKAHNAQFADASLLRRSIEKAKT